MNNTSSVNSVSVQDKVQWLFVLFCGLMFTGFVCSRALVTISMVALVVVSVTCYRAKLLQTYFRKKELVILSIFLWLVLISGCYSDDKADWLNWVRIKLPYLFLPMAFAPLSALDKRKFTALLSMFVMVFFVSVVYVLVRYVLNYEAVTHSYLLGQGIKMPYSHIRYSLMVAFAFFCCGYLLEKKLFLFFKREKWVQIVMMLFLFVALHVLSVRSGLLAMYLGILFLLFRFAFRKRRIGWVLAVAALMATTMYLAVNFVPTLKNKIAYMRYDVAGLKQNDINFHYDAMRIVSMKAALHVYGQHKLFGTGSGDLKTEMNKTYQLLFPDLKPENYLMPHNQFMWVLASLGVVGLILFLLAFFVPLGCKNNFKRPLPVLLYIIVFSSFFTEAGLEEQMGTGFFLIWLLILLNQSEHE